MVGEGGCCVKNIIGKTWQRGSSLDDGAFILEAWAQSQASPFTFCIGQTFTGTELFPITSAFL